VGSLAVRVADDDKLRKLVENTGPLLTTSANKPGEPESTNIDMARNYFGDRVDFYIDGGDYSDRLPSTVIRVVDDMVEVLRLGAVKINEKGELSNDI
jgi:L-threonylcarbamoyladenylate synthase